MKKLKTKEDFSINPDSIVSGDYVVKGDKSVNLIGEVGDRVNTSNKMLQFWITWLEKDASITPPPRCGSGRSFRTCARVPRDLRRVPDSNRRS